ncbi:MAG: capsule assembly Wzi family protein [Bacteroidetes bacterium]|nr:capsule assembly Wzi family protein [Bacteroidota bacterium]MBU1484489.1 capsule assembly Wzi family protein [Bacteroidota bacterium]MBU2267464.1 capsule assembly Wzi family protein [Bacteroidota bacterium]MBU2375209.1 capsule assembly Wzi family protein [Bacteroidota bacterium]
MKKYLFICCSFITVLLFNSSPISAQTIAVGFANLEDYYRQNQLLSDSSFDKLSHTIRPIYPTKNFGVRSEYFIDTLRTPHNLLKIQSGYQSKNELINFHLLPIQFQTRFNSDHPYGWNDGPMIPASGLQTYFSAGFYGKIGPISIQLQPEIVLAANPEFEGFSDKNFKVFTARYYDFYNKIDLPERFGNSSFGETYWGQSSVRINSKNVSFGLSTENLWWGPGISNSLLMSNTAPGFKHFTLNTIKPIATRVGSFEGQIIAGWPQTSKYGVLTPELTYFNEPLYVPKSRNQRYLSGMIFTWQPKWIKGLFLGFDRTLQLYTHQQGNRIGDYLPLFSPFQSVSADESLVKRQQMGAVFFRWIWPESKAEFYGEFGRHHQNTSLRNNLLETEKNRGYIVGLRKVLPLKNKDEHLLISAEVSQLNETNSNDITNLNSWYINSFITAGYTHQGQEIGAGIGPGANIQQVSVSWNKGLKKIGLEVERYLHNDDFYYYALQDSYDFRRHWYDLSLKASGTWDYQNLLFNANIFATRSYNYKYYLEQKPGDPYFVYGLNKFNLQIQLGVNYRF